MSSAIHAYFCRLPFFQIVFISHSPPHNKSVWFCFLVISGCLSSQFVYSQITPPGLDGAKVVYWTAVGFNQRISKRWSTTIYAGGSSQGDPDTYSPFKKPAIFVLNQETLYSFRAHWQIALCTSLRFQELYEDKAPYSPREPSWRKEVRYYARFFYRASTPAATWLFSVRPEYRTFYAVDGEPWSVPVQWRFRAKAQVNLPLNSRKNNFFIGANEWLWATEKSGPDTWTAFQFTEDRLSTFFRHAVKKPNVFVDIGLMHQFWMDKARTLNYTTYLSLDLLFQNPFGHKTKS